MQTPLQYEGIRRRLGGLVQQQYGDLSPVALRTLSSKARVHYTSLARYLLYSRQKRTLSLRRQTLDAVAIALDVNPDWLRDGQSPKQLGLWPLLLPTIAESGVTNPEDQVVAVLKDVRALPDRVRLKAYRAAIAALIETVTNEDQNLGERAYRLLMRLDALRRLPGARVAS